MKRNNRREFLKAMLIAGIAGIIVGVGAAYIGNDTFTSGTSYPRVGIGGGPAVEEPTGAEKTISGWPIESAETAGKLIDKYGQPDEESPDRLVWNFQDYWERIAVYRDEQNPEIFGENSYLLEQRINYQTEESTFTRLITEDGSVVVDTVKGELTARSNDEALNLLALNLANDILTNKQSTDQAKKDYSNNRQKYLNGESVPYTQKLQFNIPPAGNVRESGETIMR